MTIRISISCEPDEIDEVRRLLLGFVVCDIKLTEGVLDDHGKITPSAERDILARYDDGEAIKDIAADLGIDGRQISGLVLGKRKSLQSHYMREKAAMADQSGRLARQ